MKTRPSLATTFRWPLVCSITTPDWLKGGWILRREGRAEALRGLRDGAGKALALMCGIRARCPWMVAAGVRGTLSQGRL